MNFARLPGGDVMVVIVRWALEVLMWRLWVGNVEVGMIGNHPQLVRFVLLVMD